jgi:signal transduction histidine kinase/PAS domain-containing protein
MHDSQAVDAFVSRLSEKARYLKAREAELPPALRSLAATAVHDLEQGAEELRVTNQEIRQQSEMLASTTAVLQMERARFRRLFDLGPDPCVVTDLHGGIVDCNRACAKLLDRDRNLLHRKPLAALLAADSVRPFRAALVRLERLEEVRDLELQLLTRAADTIPVSVRAAQLPATPDEEARIVWSMRDQSDLHTLLATRDELATERASRELAEAIMQAAYLARASARLSAETDATRIAETAARLAVEEYGRTCIVYLIEEDGSLTRAAVAHRSDRHEQETQEELVKARFGAAPLDVDEERAVLELMKRGAVVEGEDLSRLLGVLEAIAPSFFATPELSAIALPLKARGNTFGLRLVVFQADQDLPTVRSLSQALASYSSMALANAQLISGAERGKREAEEVSRGRTRAMAGLSHELRTPLHSILGYCELLLDHVHGPLADKVERAVGSIRSSALHQVRLVNDILALSKSGAQGLEVSPSKIMVDDVIREALAMVKDRSSARGISLRSDVPEQLAVTTDRSKLLQILINLLENGVKFTDRGEVVVSAQAVDDQLAVTVRDTGRGISSAELPLIFDAFWQGSSSEKAGGEGAGLGLAMVERLVTALGGRVDVQSREGEGSTFRVLLPSHPPRAVAAAPPPRSERSERLPAR